MFILDAQVVLFSKLIILVLDTSSFIPGVIKLMFSTIYLVDVVEFVC